MAFCAQVIHCVHHILHIYKYTDIWEPTPPQPPVALKLVIMTAPCGQWRQCSQYVNSRSSVYGPIWKKTKKNKQINMNAQYTRAKMAKGDKKPRKVYGPLGYRLRIFLVRNNQCRVYRCSGNRLHKCTEIMSKLNNDDNSNNNSKIKSIDSWWIKLYINCWLMHFFNITLNGCSELSELILTLNILFQIMTPWYLIPVLDRFVPVNGTCKWLAVLV